MYIEHRKPYRRPISLRNEIDLLLHCPFGGLIGEGLLPHDYTSAAPYKISVKAKQAGRNKNDYNLQHREYHIRKNVACHKIRRRHWCSIKSS